LGFNTPVSCGATHREWIDDVPAEPWPVNTPRSQMQMADSPWGSGFFSFSDTGLQHPLVVLICCIGTVHKCLLPDLLPPCVLPARKQKLPFYLPRFPKACLQPTPISRNSRRSLIEMRNTPERCSKKWGIGSIRTQIWNALLKPQATAIRGTFDPQFNHWSAVRANSAV
jgi:hypothetical protein